MLYLEKPADFKPRHVVSICVIDCNGEILLLKRQSNKFKGGMWDVPGGKLEPGETPIDTIIREVFEETGIKLKKESLEFLQENYVRYPEFDFTSNIFCYRLNKKPEVKIDLEAHSEYAWKIYRDALKMDLVPDEAGRIEMVINELGGK